MMRQYLYSRSHSDLLANIRELQVGDDVIANTSSVCLQQMEHMNFGDCPSRTQYFQLLKSYRQPRVLDAISAIRCI